MFPLKSLSAFKFQNITLQPLYITLLKPRIHFYPQMKKQPGRGCRLKLHSAMVSRLRKIYSNFLNITCIDFQFSIAFNSKVAVIQKVPINHFALYDTLSQKPQNTFRNNALIPLALYNENQYNQMSSFHQNYTVCQKAQHKHACCYPTSHAPA